MNRKTTIWLVGTMLALGIVLGIAASTMRPGPVQHDREPIEPPSESIIQAKLVISFVNIFLMCTLLIIYIDIYCTIRSRFTIGLILTISALLIYAITSNPVLQMVLGYPVTGPGPFMFIPDIFTAMAAGVLTYLSIE
jgi:hypothetical protein